MDEIDVVIAELEEEKAEIEAVIGILRRRQARKTATPTSPAELEDPQLLHGRVVANTVRANAQEFVRKYVPQPAAPIPPAEQEDPTHQEGEPEPVAVSAGGRPGLAARTKRGPGRPPIPRD